MQQDKTTGLLLQSTPYLERHRILKVFTPESGLLSFIAHSSNLKNCGALSTPFLWGEWVYKKGRNDLYTLQDGSILDPLEPLKDTYSALTAAGRIVQDILHTQFPGKAAPDLVALTLAYLRAIPNVQDPCMLVASFRLKLLMYEGLLDVKELVSRELQELALARSFQKLASFPKEEGTLKQIDLLFQQCTERDSNP